MSMPMNSVRRDRRARTPLGAVLALCLALVSGAWAGPIRAQGVGDETFSAAELIDSGHRLFGSASRGLALTVQEAVKRWGEPNGYVLGEEASGALFGGVRYGKGVLYTRNAGQRRVYWQGPSLGFDVGGDGARTMMLVYNLPSTEALYTRFVGLNGAAYLVGGFGLTAEAWAPPSRAGPDASGRLRESGEAVQVAHDDALASDAHDA